MNPPLYMYFSPANSIVRTEILRLNLPIIPAHDNRCSSLLRIPSFIFRQTSSSSQKPVRSPNQSAWRIPLPSLWCSNCVEREAAMLLDCLHGTHVFQMKQPSLCQGLSGGQPLPPLYSTKWLHHIKERDRVFSLLSIWYVACCCQLVMLNVKQ